MDGMEGRYEPEPLDGFPFDAGSARCLACDTLLDAGSWVRVLRTPGDGLTPETAPVYDVVCVPCLVDAPAGDALRRPPGH
jgi:hypothetical protein